MYGTNSRFGNRVEKKANKVIGIAMFMSVIGVLFNIGIVAAIIWIAYHFLSKIW